MRKERGCCTSQSGMAAGRKGDEPGQVGFGSWASGGNAWSGWLPLTGRFCRSEESGLERCRRKD